MSVLDYFERLRREHGYSERDPYCKIPATFWWLSFVDPDRPEGQRFLGVSIVGPACCFDEALMLSHIAKCNPGGSVLGHPVDPQHVDRLPLNERNRLLTREETLAVDALIAP